jgi:hypothetical protein
LETVRRDLEPTFLAEWVAEDEVNGVLSDDTAIPADEDAARTVLNEVDD